MKEIDKIVVLDFGSQYNMLITRRIRELEVFSQLHPYSISAEEIMALGNVRGIILSGGPHSVYDDSAMKCDPAIFELGIPVLGICYGMQLMSYCFGGIVEPSKVSEYGKTEILVHTDHPLFLNTKQKQNVWMSHNDHVKVLPRGFSVIADSQECIAGIVHEAKKLYALQFHPEVQHTEYGKMILDNFLEICHAKREWKMKHYIDLQIQKIREIARGKSVLCGLSGGVDSTVTAVLIHRAIKDQLVCMFVDHGLLRKNEGDDVMNMLEKNFQMKVIRINARERFLNKLKGISDPEQKRKIIGNEFIYCFEEESHKLGEFSYLAQGTIYPDVVESGTKTSQTIKSHHNVGGLPKDMKFQLIEPLRDLFKDEVRVLGEELGIPKELVYRQPFPGPGLGIRILGEVTEEKIKKVQDSDFILREEVKNAGLDQEIWQYFTCLPNCKSVGVVGDQRVYSDVICIRAVTSVDGMTSDWARIPYDVLDKISRRITNEVKGVSRVVLDCTSKPPATIEWE